MVTIKDIAKICNVSIATVSRAFRGNPHISPETRNLILSKSKELGYIVDTNAQTLQSGVSHTIGIIVSDISNYFYNIILSNLYIEFEKYGYKLIVSYSFENEEKERESFKFLLSSKVDAIIFTPINNTNEDLIKIIKDRNIPIVQLFRKAYPEIDSICVDDGFGAYLATTHFIERNYKKIMLLSVDLHFTPSRSKGYKQAMSEHNLPIDENLICKFPIGNSIEPQLVQLFKKYKPEAIIAGTNTYGLDAIKAMNKINVNVPLIVFDNLDWLKLLEISTVAQPIKEIYEQVVDNIITKLKDSNYVSQSQGFDIRIKPELIIRKSS